MFPICDLPPVQTVQVVSQENARRVVLHHVAEQVSADFRDPARPGKISPAWVVEATRYIRRSGGDPKILTRWVAQEEARAEAAGEEPVLPRETPAYTPRYHHAVDITGNVHSAPIGVAISGGSLRITHFIDD